MEDFLRMPPGRPVYVPMHTFEKILGHYQINPQHGGALYKNELEAHHALFAPSPRKAGKS